MRALIGYSNSGYPVLPSATQCYSLQLLRTSDVKLAALANEEISKIIKQAVPEIHEEGDEIRFGSFNRQSFV